MKLSVVMPIYNERIILRQVVESVLAAPMELEVLCVDDGSNHGSREILAELDAQYRQIRVLRNHEIGGKELSSAGESKKLPEILSSFRMQTWNMIRRNIRYSSVRSFKEKRTSCTAHASWAPRHIVCCTSSTQ